MAISHNGMRVVNKEPMDGLWFKHESPYDVYPLFPMSYHHLAEKKGREFAYQRKLIDDKLRLLCGHNANYSFLHATVVGGNNMEEPSLYEGFTYYFQLPETKIEQCIFFISLYPDMPPTLGGIGLKTAIEIWETHPELHYWQDQRIEVIMPFGVEPSLVFPQLEDR